MYDMQYFVKFLILNKTPSVMLFGFCAPTEQPLRQWKTIGCGNKLSLFCCTAIINAEEKDELLNNLKKQTPFIRGKIKIDTSLTARPTVFPNTSGSEWERNKPVSNLHTVDEFWNLDKNSIMNHIKGSFAPAIGYALRQKIQLLFGELKKECGIDFTKEGGRLGNFEYYSPGKYINSFEVKAKDKTSILLRKKHDILEELVVSCTVENGGRWVIDEIKSFSPDSDELTFTARESTTHYKIKVWEKANGSLAYASENAFIMEISLNMSLIGSQKTIQDPWTQSLRKSTNHENRINEIESVSTSSMYDTMNIGAEKNQLWRKSKINGENLFSPFNETKAKGAFIHKTVDRKGEIESFLKIRSYISDHNISKVILADPYFSVKSAAKLLSRLSSQNLELRIVTALTNKDPDTNESIDAKEQCRSFLERYRNILHPNMIIQNVLRGKKQAFHDRYLIRYFDDGRIDGFLLSNSLNSAGQSFPYVIAPLEYEVLLQVKEYLQNLTSLEFQKNIKKKEERAEIELLFEPIKYQKSTKTQRETILPKFLSGDDDIQRAISRCVELNYFKGESDVSRFSVLSEAFPKIIPAIFQNWDNDPESMMTALGESLYHTNIYGMREAKKAMESIPEAIVIQVDKGYWI